MNEVKIAISPCPNDTYIFAAMVLGLVSLEPECELRFTWEDVQRLNEMAKGGEADLIKVSAVQGLMLGDSYEIIRSGGAYGVLDGPKLVSMNGRLAASPRIAVPGLDTTAVALLRGALGSDFEAVPLRFDKIVAAVKTGQVDAGLLIHETALIYRSHAMQLVLDLGEWWSDYADGSPLPLGVILARKSLGREMIDKLDLLVRKSLARAQSDRTSVWPLVRAMAQEMDDLTLDAHIKAYVNQFSVDMGESGFEGLRKMAVLIKEQD